MATGPGKGERRRQARVATKGEVYVAANWGVGWAKLLDLSRSGARLESPGSLGSPGETFRMFLPGPSAGGEIGVMAEILRTGKAGNGHIVSVRFCAVEARQDAALDDLVSTVALIDGEDRRRHPRVAHRIPLRYQSGARLAAMLNDISQGGLSLTTDEDPGPSEEVVVVIPDRDDKDLLCLPAQVADRERVGKELRLRLVFAPMAPERRILLAALVHFYGRL